jgi:hypothetical protein
LERNHQYCYGRKIILWTDHKPLVSITRKPLAAAPKRLQNLLIRLKQYDVDIRYKPGTQMYLADTLSRAFLKDNTRSSVEEETESIHMIDTVPVTETTCTETKTATADDEGLQTVKQYILNGWPDNKQQLPRVVQPYFNVRDELSYQDGIIFRGTQIVIPRAERRNIREKLHRAHTGLQSTIRRARDTVYWPGMSNDLKDYLSNCDICNSDQSQQQKEPLINHKLPDRPWEKIGIDLFTIDDKDYLCTVDYFSDYFEIDRLPHKKDSKTIIKHMKHHFSRYGLPDMIFSDNGPPFNSQDFVNFAKDYEFVHKTSSPEFPQSNGKVESAVKIAKKNKPLFLPELIRVAQMAD